MTIVHSLHAYDCVALCTLAIQLIFVLLSLRAVRVLLKRCAWPSQFSTLGHQTEGISMRVLVLLLLTCPLSMLSTHLIKNISCEL